MHIALQWYAAQWKTIHAIVLILAFEWQHNIYLSAWHCWKPWQQHIALVNIGNITLFSWFAVK
jgi:hypothetical protein